MLDPKVQEILGGKSLGDALLSALNEVSKVKFALQHIDNQTMDRLSEAGHTDELHNLAIDIEKTTDWIRNDFCRRLWNKV